MTIKQKLTWFGAQWIVVILLLAWAAATAEDCSGSADPPRTTTPSPVCLVIHTTADPGKYKNVRVDPEQVKKDCG